MAPSPRPARRPLLQSWDSKGHVKPMLPVPPPPEVPIRPRSAPLCGNPKETPRKPKVGGARRPRKPGAALHQLVTTGSVKKALTFLKPNERPPQDQIDWCPLSEVRAPLQRPPFTNFGKPWALENLLVPVPPCRSEVPDRTRRLPCRDFRSAVLAGLSTAFSHQVMRSAHTWAKCWYRNGYEIARGPGAENSVSIYLKIAVAAVLPAFEY